MEDCRRGTPMPMVAQIKITTFPDTIDETWEIVNANKDGLMEVIYAFGGLTKGAVAEEMIKEKKASFHSLMEDVWLKAPEDWYALHQYACWELLCDLISDGVFYEQRSS